MKDLIGYSLTLLGAPRLGIEVGSKYLRSVLIVRGMVVRAQSADLDPEESLEMAVQQFVDAGCHGLWRKPRVYAALGASCSQLRRLVGLPTASSNRALRDIVRGSAGRFFLKDGVPLLTSSVRRQADGTGWAAAIDEPAVRAVVEACRSRRVRLQTAVPTVVALQQALVSDLLSAADGDILVQARVGSHGEMLDVRRTIIGKNEESDGKATPVAALGSLGTDASQYAAAFGATAIDRSEPLALHATDFRQWRDTSVPAWRMSVAVVALLIALALALTFPTVRVSHVAARTSARLAAINPQYRAAQWTELELQKTTIALNAIADFQQSRRAVIGFFGQLTATLPEDVWLQSIHVDGQGGTLIALAPRAVTALDGLSRIESITAPVIVGAVSTEQMGTTRIERVAIRFRWRAGKRAGTRQ